MEDLGAALSRLDASSRELLELSRRRGLADDEVAELMRTDRQEVGRRRAEILERLAADLGLDGREERDELFATLPDLPPRLWET
jgi:DNA-directed RNA polymerase specialized sigma24 family protein